MKLGEWYYEGKGVPQDLKEAHAYFEQAAQNGNIYAKVKQGVILLNGGIGVE